MLLAMGIESPGSLQVAGKMTLSDEIGESELKQQRRELPGHADRAAEPVRQHARHNQESDAQRRKNGLAEAADINHSVGARDSAQRRNRPPPEAIFSVIVILDNPGAVTLRNCQELQPFLHSHGLAAWPLAGWRHVYEPERGLGRR